jgi:hypothetical protein
MTRAPISALLGLFAAGSAAAQEPPRCAASGWDSLRTADQAIADVARARCPPGSRLDVAMTVAGQAIVLQRSGLCQPDTVQTRTVRPTPETRALGFRCELAGR